MACIFSGMGLTPALQPNSLQCLRARCIPQPSSLRCPLSVGLKPHIKTHTLFGQCLISTFTLLKLNFFGLCTLLVCWVFFLSTCFLWSALLTVLGKSCPNTRINGIPPVWVTSSWHIQKNTYSNGKKFPTHLCKIPRGTDVSH